MHLSINSRKVWIFCWLFVKIHTVSSGHCGKSPTPDLCDFFEMILLDKLFMFKKRNFRCNASYWFYLLPRSNLILTQVDIFVWQIQDVRCTQSTTSLHIALPDTDYYHILTIISQVLDLDGLNMCRGSDVCVILWVISAGVMTFCWHFN